MHSIRNARAAYRAPFESLGKLLSKNRAAVRVSITAVTLALVFAVSQQGVSRAGPEPIVAPPRSILPANVGVGIPTSASVVIPFERAVDRASVEAGLSVIPEARVTFRWSPDNRSVEVLPLRRWVTDQRYVLIVPSSTRFADGRSAGSAERLSFTTETAPAVSDFHVDYVAEDPARLTGAARDGLREYGPRADGAVADTIEERLRESPAGATNDTADEVSAHTTIRISFSAPMDAGEVIDRFTISPQVDGDLNWEGRTLVFSPSEPLKSGKRYAISLAGTHDLAGNPLGGDTSYSFTTVRAGQPVKVRPVKDARHVTSRTVRLWFSQPMATDRTGDAFVLRDRTARRSVAGHLRWNDDGTQLRFTAKHKLAKGHRFRIELRKGALDSDGNPVRFASSFTSKAPPPRQPAPAQVQTTVRSAPRPPAPPPPAPSASAVGYALNQVNAARSAYGFRGLSLDSAVSAVAADHAWDMLRNNYFSHTGLDGSTVRTRLTRAGIAYSHAGENICYHAGMSVGATLRWCHSQFMAEPYPGFFNHIGNILDPDFRRLGVGIAAQGGKVYVVWDFAG